MSAPIQDRVATAAGFAPVSLLLRLEAAAVFVAAVAAYTYLDFSWWLFAALILAPDLAFVGYLGGKAAGAWLYDLAHTYVFPALLALAGYLFGEPLLMALAAIWFAHIGVDRVLGYGLKFTGDFKDNHLSRLSAKIG